MAYDGCSAPIAGATTSAPVSSRARPSTNGNASTLLAPCVIDACRRKGAANQPLSYATVVELIAVGKAHCQPVDAPEYCSTWPGRQLASDKVAVPDVTPPVKPLPAGVVTPP